MNDGTAVNTLSKATCAPINCTISNPPSMSSRMQAKVGLWIFLVGVSSVIGAIYVYALTVYYNVPYDLIAFGRGVGTGAVVGALLTGFENFIVDSHKFNFFRKLPFIKFLLIRSLVATGLSVTGLLASRATFGLPENLLVLNQSSQLLRDVIFSIITLQIIYFVVQVNRIIGHKTLRRFMAGQYNTPIKEEKAFMFLDMSGSTTLAEEMGDIGVHSLMSKFFFDIDEMILRYKGEVHRYIGDEVMVTWDAKDAFENANCIRCFFAIETHIAIKNQEYMKQFGTIPHFRAGIHFGPVVTGECGDSKREISYFGDTVNTSARIQAQCKEQGRRLIVSETVLEKLGERPEGLDLESLGDFILRGRSNALGLYSLEREAPLVVV